MGTDRGRKSHNSFEHYTKKQIRIFVNLVKNILNSASLKKFRENNFYKNEQEGQSQKNYYEKKK